jgi:hypothetical protein
MALTERRYIGRDLEPVASGTLADWLDFNITTKFNTSDATASDSDDDEVTIGTRLLEGDATGFVSNLSNPGTLPAAGDLIEDLGNTASGDSIIPDISAYSNIRVLEFTTNGSKDAAKWSMKFRSGVLNAPPA